jgi:hypothetical protein
VPKRVDNVAKSPKASIIWSFKLLLPKWARIMTKIDVGHTSHLERPVWDFTLLRLAQFVYISRRLEDLRGMHWVSLPYVTI